MSFKSVVHFPIKVDSIQYREVFLIFSRSSPSVTPVTEEHFYSINATQDHQILHFMTQQYDEAWRRSQNGSLALLPVNYCIMTFMVVFHSFSRFFHYWVGLGTYTCCARPVLLTTNPLIFLSAATCLQIFEWHDNRVIVRNKMWAADNAKRRTRDPPLLADRGSVGGGDGSNLPPSPRPNPPTTPRPPDPLVGPTPPTPPVILPTLSSSVTSVSPGDFQH